MAEASTSSPIFRRAKSIPRRFGVDGGHVWTTFFGRIPCQARAHRPERARPQGGPEHPGRGNDDLKRLNQTKDPAKRKEILEGMLEEVPRHAHGRARRRGCWRSIRPRPRLRKRRCALIDQTARVAARYGREMEIGAIHTVIQNLVGMEELEDMVLEYARKAVAMLRPRTRPLSRDPP